MKFQSSNQWSKVACATSLVFAVGCATPRQVLKVRSFPAEAKVCIKGKTGSQILPTEKQCVGETPFEAERIKIRDNTGKTRMVSISDLVEQDKSFYLTVNRKGYSAESATVPGLEHYLSLKYEGKTADADPLKNMGTVQISSQPEGALVYIDGALKGNTPYTYEGKKGSIRVKIESHGFETMDKVLVVSENAKQAINFNLRPNVAQEEGKAKNTHMSSLRITSQPAGAVVYVNNSPQGNTPLVYEADSGSAVAIQLAMPGYKKLSTTVRMGKAGKQFNVNFPLQKQDTRSAMVSAPQSKDATQ